MPRASRDKLDQTGKAKRQVHCDVLVEKDVHFDTVYKCDAIVIACNNMRSTVTWADIRTQSVGGGVMPLWDSLARCRAMNTTDGCLILNCRTVLIFPVVKRSSSVCHFDF